MGCFTGSLARLLISGANLLAAILAAAGFVVGVLIARIYEAYGDWIPHSSMVHINALEGCCLVVIVMTILGIVVLCCCPQKVVLTMYLVVGALTAVSLVTISGVGVSHVERADNATYTAMLDDAHGYYDLDQPEQTAVNDRYTKLLCCGANNFTDFDTGEDVFKLPTGCCLDADRLPSLARTPCLSISRNVTLIGCYSLITVTYHFAAHYIFLLGCLFGLSLLCLLAITFGLIKCTSALPI